MESLLDKPIADLPKEWQRKLTKIIAEHDQMGYYLLSDFGFSRDQERTIERKCSGSKDPVRKFVYLLLDEDDLTIAQMSEALEKCEMFEANEELQYIRRDFVHFHELQPHDYELMIKYFRGTGGSLFIDGWQNLLTLIGLSKHIPYFETLGL